MKKFQKYICVCIKGQELEFIYNEIISFYAYSETFKYTKNCICIIVNKIFLRKYL